MGHSYNEIDLPYFKRIAESVNEKTKWILYYYSEEDKDNADKIMREINIADDLQEYKHCNELQIEDFQLKLF